MLLLVGLGNPNPNNVNNRHNVGFLVIDAINEKFKLSKYLRSLKINGIAKSHTTDINLIESFSPLL